MTEDLGERARHRSIESIDDTSSSSRFAHRFLVVCDPAPAYPDVTVFPLKKVALRLFCRPRTLPQCSDFKELSRSDPTETAPCAELP